MILKSSVARSAARPACACGVNSIECSWARATATLVFIRASVYYGMDRSRPYQVESPHHHVYFDETLIVFTYVRKTDSIQRIVYYHFCTNCSYSTYEGTQARLQPTVLCRSRALYVAQVWHQGPAASMGDCVTGQLVSANRLATLMRPPALRNWLPQEHKLWLKLEAPANLFVGSISVVPSAQKMDERHGRPKNSRPHDFRPPCRKTYILRN